jgi:MFS family permease
VSSALAPARAGPPRRLPPVLRPFVHREYRLLVGAAAFTLFVDGLWPVGCVWQVIALGGGPSELSAVAAASATGLLAAVLLGGVAADRLPRRAVLVAVEVVRAAVAAVAGALALTGALQVWHLAVLGFVVGASEGFFYPAYSALLPSLLPAEQLLAANGVEGVLRPLGQQAVGPVAAGLLVAAFAPGAALLAAGIGNVLALVPLLAMRPVPAVGAGSDGSVLRRLGEGFAYLFRTRWLFAAVAFASLYVLVVVGPIEVLLPFAVRDLGAGPEGFSLVLASYGIGCALGALAVSSRRLPRRYLTVMLLCWGLGALPLMAFGLATALWVMLVAGLVVGLTDAAGMVIWGTLLQRRVPAHLLGRVSSLDFFVSLALMPLSMALAGPVGERVGVPATFVVAGTLPLVLALAALVAWRLPRDEAAHPLDRPAQPGRG